MQEIEIDRAVSKTKLWLAGTVIKLNLCPFAKAVHLKNQIRYQVSSAKSAQELLHDLIAELKFFVAANADAIETSLLIHPNALLNFLDYNDFLDLTDAALEELDLLGVVQIASFHPDYQFEGTKPDDVENFTNRSPYPMLHLLREASVEKAVASYPDPENIPARNIENLKTLSPQKLKVLKSLLFES